MNLIPFRSPEARRLYSQIRKDMERRSERVEEKAYEIPGLLLILILVLFASNVAAWVAIFALVEMQ